MNVPDVLKVLGVGSLIDARLGAKTDDDKIGKAAAWAEALDNDMPVAWACRAIARHYAESVATCMPADLNKAWRIEAREARRKQREEELREIQQAEKANAVPMPDYVRQQLKELMTKGAI